jgi:hypothetical protein
LPSLRAARGKSEPLKASKALKSDVATGSFAYKNINGQEFSFDADLTGGGEKSALVRIDDTI